MKTYIYREINTTSAKGQYVTLRHRMKMPREVRNISNERFTLWLYTAKENAFSPDHNFLYAPVKISSLETIRIIFEQCNGSLYQVTNVVIDPCSEHPCAWRRGSLYELTMSYNPGNSSFRKDPPADRYGVVVTYANNYHQQTLTAPIITRSGNIETVAVLLTVPDNIIRIDDEVMKVRFVRYSRVGGNVTMHYQACFNVVVKIVW